MKMIVNTSIKLLLIPLISLLSSCVQHGTEYLDADFYVNRGNAYTWEGQYDQAISYYTKALEINPREAKAYYYLADTYYYYKHQYDQAIFNYTKALEIDPRHSQAYNRRGMAHDKKGEYDQAISDYTKALEFNPTYAEAYSNRRVAYYFKREYEKSWKDVEKAQSLGYQIPADFLNQLRKASGREK